ncbi:hypothetical protein C6P46_002994 [Rhodotorula mucilaginosa]|uniref:Mitochondrial carrier n=1 Tax=Rhodotorula mucilaginosa TaxID=5537 RepID=A0A9P6W3R4_RHOMI|nr:hypothetical protein C6P46_002994 [Rhodotorula mucilaginosa]
MTGLLPPPHPTNPVIEVPRDEPVPAPRTSRTKRTKPPPAVHLVAGGIGGMCGAIVTAPLDVVKTRLQSNLFQKQAAAEGTVLHRHGVRGLLWNFVDTGKIIRDVYVHEGSRALFKGLGPTLAGAVPARSINFFVYGNGKHLYAEWFNGVATAAATNPLWVVKTDMQLRHQERQAAATNPPGTPASTSSSSRKRPLPTPPKAHKHLFAHSFRSLTSPPLPLQGPPPRPTSWSTTVDIFRNQGVRGFYRGLSASLLGVTEGTIQWTLYEQFKRWARAGPDGNPVEGSEWKVSLAAGAAKFVATIITYPHEVVRTRLRQPLPPSGVPKYRSLVQTFKLVVHEEGWRVLYSGLSAHLLRVIPNAITMFAVYEGVLTYVEKRQQRSLDLETLRERCRD